MKQLKLTSPLPENWTVRDVEARLPKKLRKMNRSYLIRISPTATKQDVEFMVQMNMDERDALNSHFERLVKANKLLTHQILDSIEWNMDMVMMVIDMLWRQTDGNSS